LEASWIY
jgi:hypothetical protein